MDSEDSCEWRECECDAYLYSRIWRPVPVEHLAKMLGISLERLELASSSQVRAFEALGVDPVIIPWALALGRDRFKDKVKRITAALEGLTRDPNITRYVETYRIARNFLAGLERPLIDANRMRSHKAECESGAAVVGTLLTFAPQDDGLAAQIEYDQVSTATGRLTVTRGPRILTLAREHRDIIRSKTGGGIYEVDFVSLEPRFALHLAGACPPRDIYEDIRSRTSSSGAERKDVKLAVISALYGSSSAALAGALGGQRQARELVSEVKDLFQVDHLARKLRGEMESLGRLYNYYGRPLPEVSLEDKDSKLISHYIQSSSVDATLIGFSQLMSRVRHLGVKPIYVIHDALLLDVPPGAEEDLRRELEAGVKLEVGRFELGIKRVS